MRRWIWQWLAVLSVGMVTGEEVWEMGPYLVEAWHFDQLGKGIPAEVVRVEGARIRESGLASVPEVLEQLGGVRFRGLTGNGTEGQVSLRGFGENSGLRVLILVDGQVFNPPDMSGINWTGLSVEELEVVEVIRGGQGVLYGNHAVSGVVKLRTRDPGEAFSGRVKGTSGSDGEQNLSGSLEGRVGGTGYRAGGNYWSTDGYRENAAAKTRSAYLTWRPLGNRAVNWRGRLQWDEQETQFPGPLLYAQLRENPRQSTNAGEDRSNRDVLNATLHGGGEWGAGEWEFNSGFLERETRWSLDGLPGDNLHRRLTASPRLKTNLHSGFIITGIDLNRDWLETREFPGSWETVTKARAELERTTAGLYFLGSHDVGDRLTLSGGFRRELARTDNDYLHYKTEQLLPYIETNRGVVPNPQYREFPEADPDLSFTGLVEKSGWAAELSGTYSLSDSLVAWAGWDRVYRYPSVDETASFQGYPLASPLNLELQPETGNNLEAGLKWAGTNWHVSGTLFWMRLADEIVFDEDARLNLNIGQTDRRGLELSGSFSAENWGLSGNLNWVRAVFDDTSLVYDGSRIPLVPEYEAGLSIWRSLWGAVRLRVHVQALARQIQGNDFGNNRRPIDAYALASLHLRWSPAPDLTLGAGIKNLFDEVHAVSAYNGGFYPGAGRQIRAELTYRF
jgi:iron complex outermembrane receptor protein